MALVVADRVQETSTTSGTGTLTLAGALAGYQTFSTAVGNGNTTFYTIYDPTVFDWEVGIGTVGAGTLARTTVLSNSAGTTSQISFASNAKFVFCTYPAEKSINYDANGVATIGEVLGYSDTGIVGSFVSTVAGYNQVIVQNKSSATNASSNLNVSNDAGTAGNNYAELGINSSTFTGSGSFNIAGASYVASASTDLTLGTYGAYNVHFVTNSSTTDAMTIYNDGGISLGAFANPGMGNIAASKFVPGYSAVTSAAGTTVLTEDSNYYQNLLGSTTQTFRLPDATTLLVGTTFIFDNNSSGNLTVVDNASGPIEIIPSGAAGFVYLYNNSTVAGSWNKHSFLPASYDFNSTTANFGNATINNATWNGTTIATNHGGTGLTSFSAANYALYSTNSSTLTAGTLPVAAGGTAATTFTANGVLYGNGTSALGVTAVGTTGQVLIGNTGGAPSWATLSSSTVSSFSAGTTGFTPNSATTGAVTLAGTLNVANGGTGLNTLTAGYIPYGNGTSAFSSNAALQYSIQYSAGANPIVYSTNGVAAGTGTISYPSTNTGVGFYSRGVTSNGGILIQDGQGRLNQYWNAYTDSGGVKYIVTGEPAARYLMSVNSTTGASHAWYGAPSGTSGSALTWTTMANWVSGTGGFAWISPRGTSSDFYIDINGNVGMGTTSLSAKLGITSAALGTTAGSQSKYQILNSSTVGNGDFLEITNTRETAGSSWIGAGSRLQQRVDATYMAYIQFNGGAGTTNDNGISFGTGSNASATGVAEQMRITSAGNVGIGTTSPTVKLDVVGSIEASPAATQDGVIIAGRAGGTSSYAVTLTPTTLTASRTITLPDATTTMVGTDTTQTLTNKRVTPRFLAYTSNSATPLNGISSDDYDIIVITGQSTAITSMTTGFTGTPTNGQKLWISITGTTAIAITWGASFESSTVTLPTTTVSTNRLDVGFVWNVANSDWRCVAVA
jgi:hypothetical protein